MHGGGAQFIRSLVNHLATLSENYKRTPPPPPPGMDGERVDFSSCFTAGWRRERRLRLVVVNPPSKLTPSLLLHNSAFLRPLLLHPPGAAAVSPPPFFAKEKESFFPNGAR